MTLFGSSKLQQLHLIRALKRFKLINRKGEGCNVSYQSVQCQAEAGYTQVMYERYRRAALRRVQ